MKKILFLITIYSMLIASDIYQKELPIGLTAEEQSRIHEINQMGRSTDPPPLPIRNIAEYERMSGILIRYPFGISTDLIREMAEDVIVYCLVSSGQQSSAQSTMVSGNVNMENVEFVLGNTDSYWTRDYGPWWVVDGNRDVSVVDFTYNRPRPNDNDAPTKMSTLLGTPYFASDVIHAGGNYMTDGMGISASTLLVVEENPDLSEEQIETLFQSYYGIDSYHLLDDPTDTYIDHIDTWAKYLSPGKVMIREVPESHAQYDEIEASVTYFETSMNVWGEPWEIARIWTPNNEPYTNSLILNEKVLVPVTNSQWDDEAIASYQEAMPGYEILSFTGSWESTDALHCRIKGIPDLEMIQIFHNPMDDSTESETQGYLIEAEIDALSESGLVEDSVKTFWKGENDDTWSILPMFGNDVPEDLDYRFTYIPPLSSTTTIQYYIEAQDQTGKIEKCPIGGYYEFLALPTDACNEWILGDLDHDLNLDITDVLLLVDYILFDDSPGLCAESVADVSEDGNHGFIDIYMLINEIMNPSTNQ
ncbi:MAG: hypothetical protein HN657_06340 [Candidatus Marinimicrobia bacterium]|jgi:agmatine/peptidylarginine deiminase|nr:hypothetical protein [Candidatus Neomarinimicrobiota bacterium]MBT3496302.1 hypothetical protein [Candidatus Neomarinimicrobiota bacterium]MBT3691974.1 hypothetical protein [Candidatus Neomarinimicrobiota bacterium]MBT3732225.1 hypothetical protein [Candidatus Neomarinimicrobiota bacterium]MBT4144528.1 hypothetical protein [Candidatus Neomarinimicrobiota bacterium]